MTDQPKPATTFTQQVNRAASAAVLNFDDATDFEFARRGFVTAHETGQALLDDRVVWDVARHDFFREGGDRNPAPDTVHPGLWRQGKLNAIHGLFEVAPDVWQARGYDISNITFMAGDHGWVIIDPLTTRETAALCLDLANQMLGERPVTGIIYTHSHVDHFGGVHGVTTEDAVAAGDVRILAPEGFLHEAVSENGLAGPIMSRRSLYQFGMLLPPGPMGQAGAGLGQGIPFGRTGLIAPTETITHTGQEAIVDGIRIVFQNTPDAEAPAEMNFFFPDHGLLCMAENCSHNLHNLYPIRGAKIRDALAWSRYLHEAWQMWGDQTHTMFASHHWPRFGRDDVKAFIELQRDVYRWMHDQTIRLANHGYTPDDISATLSMPDQFGQQSHIQGYYGTVSHNVRSVFARYLGWYDGNPSKLHPHPPIDAGERYVEMMGGAAEVLQKARSYFDDGDYRWVAEVMNHVIFADPDNQEARNLSADAMEQMGYQAESGTWRNAYLTAAMELRNGSFMLGREPLGPVAAAMSGDQFMVSMGTRFTPAKLPADFFGESTDAGRLRTIQWVLTDVDETHLMGVGPSAIHHHPLGGSSPQPDVDVVASVDRATLMNLIRYPDQCDEAVEAQKLIAEGDVNIVRGFLRTMDAFPTPHLIEPQPELRR